MRNLLLLSTLLLTEQQTILNTLQPPYQQNYAIGYSNSSCVRISMFRFQSAASGQASALTLNFVPEAKPNVGDLYISLYSATAQTGATSIGLPLNVQFNTNVNQATYSLTNANWSFTRGGSYFLTFNTQDYLRMPYYTSSAGSSYSLSIQQAPLCNSTVWTTTMNYGSVLPILINITNPTVPVSATNTPTSSSTNTNTPTSSPTNTPTRTEILGLNPANSQTNTPTRTEVLGLNPENSPINSPSSTYTIGPTTTYACSNSAISPSTSVSVSVSGSVSASSLAHGQSPSSSFSQTASVSVSPSLSPLSNVIQGQAAAITYNPTAIAGYALGAIGLAVLLTCIINSANKKREIPLISSLIVHNPGHNLLPPAHISNPVVTQNGTVNIKPTNHWYRVVEDGDTYYYNEVLKKSEWFLPEGGVVIGEGLPQIK